MTQRDVDFGLARVYEVFRADSRTAFRVFRDYGEAICWARSIARAEGPARARLRSEEQ